MEQPQQRRLLEEVWVVAYYRDDPTAYADSIGGIFKDELSAKMTVILIVTLGHKEWACLFPIPFDRALPIESTVPESVLYLMKKGDEFAWFDEEGPIA